MQDCSWGHAYNKACDGGDAYAAIEYVAETGGIALLEDYEYLGQDGYCKTNTTRRVGKFKVRRGVLARGNRGEEGCPRAG